MKTGGWLIVGILIGMASLPVAAYLYLRFGYAPVATAAPPLPLEKSITHMALNARVRSEAPKQAALPINDANLIEGARAYRRYCSVCHGLIGEKDSPTSKGMFPKPPQLFQHGVTDDPVGETYWKVENGIRLTGMPAYKQSISEEDIWRMSLMLANADKLPAAATAILKQPLPAE
ncbi:MAG: cytochrome c [Acidobacteriota bacterium]|nr:cytochrome c [Acidobacteriota bacterium]